MLYYYAFFRLGASTQEPVKRCRRARRTKWGRFPYIPRHRQGAPTRRGGSFDPARDSANDAAPSRTNGGKMASLKELLGSGEKRSAVINDACKVLDLEVADKSGLTGIAIKGGYKLVQSIKPGFVREVVDHLLDDFLDALESHLSGGSGEAASRRVPTCRRTRHASQMRCWPSPTAAPTRRSAAPSRRPIRSSDPRRRSTSRPRPRACRTCWNGTLRRVERGSGPFRGPRPGPAARAPD